MRIAACLLCLVIGARAEKWPFGDGDGFSRMDLYNLGLLGAKASDADRPPPKRKARESGKRSVQMERPAGADPRGQGIKDRLNAQVKFREAFRPFAPAVLEEAAGEWFADARPSPFMLLAFAARDRAREEIAGVVHVDGSARVQTVGRDDGQPAFRRLLEAFLARTGVPVVLNTSFNVRGEPIVHTPAEALACFDRTGIDLLVLGDRVVEKA